jgi:hypothetical protein
MRSMPSHLSQAKSPRRPGPAILCRLYPPCRHYENRLSRKLAEVSSSLQRALAVLADRGGYWIGVSEAIPSMLEGVDREQAEQWQVLGRTPPVMVDLVA